LVDQAVSGGALNPRGCGNLRAYHLGSNPKTFKEWLTMNGKEAAGASSEETGRTRRPGCPAGCDQYGAADQCAVQPPSTGKAVPVMDRAASLARKTARAPISLVCANA
jgi:hypothetical protein